MKPSAPLTPAQLAQRERALLAEHGTRTLADEPRLSRADEQRITDEVRAAEAGTKQRELADHVGEMARLTSELGALARAMREHRLIDRRIYCNLDRDIRSLTATQRRLAASPGSTL